MENKWVKNFIITTFVSLYALVSIISTIHVVDFFMLSNMKWLAITLAVAFEVGAAASLASIIALKKMNKGLVWALFILLTLMQMMGNTYYAYAHLHDFQSWIELFGLVDEDPIFQKRILAIVSGSILPLVALGFIKSLVDYIKPDEAPSTESKTEDPKTPSLIEPEVQPEQEIVTESTQVLNENPTEIDVTVEKIPEKESSESDNILTEKDLREYAEKSTFHPQIH